MKAKAPTFFRRGRRRVLSVSGGGLYPTALIVGGEDYGFFTRALFGFEAHDFVTTEERDVVINVFVVGEVAGRTIFSYRRGLLVLLDVEQAVFFAPRNAFSRKPESTEACVYEKSEDISRSKVGFHEFASGNP